LESIFTFASVAAKKVAAETNTFFAEAFCGTLSVHEIASTRPDLNPTATL
jgi:hypothetical protein